MANLAGSSKLLRAMNSSAALSLLLERGRITRGELREATGLSKPTVSDALRRLVDAELALIAGHVRGGPGPNAEIYAINPDAAYAASVSVGTVSVSVSDAPPPTEAMVEAALCDLTGTVRARLARLVDLGRADPVDVVVGALSELATEAGVDLGRIDQVQLGVAGAYDRTTRTIHHVDLPGFAAPGLVARLAEQIGTQVDVDNDVNLAALAERRHGCATDAETFALLWLGDGLGLAIDLGGTLLRGARGGAGEIGYLPLYSPRRGADVRPRDLQDLLGGEAVCALAAEHGTAGRTPAEAVGAAAGDPAFVAALADRVALALGVVVSVLDPALAVLAGPVARSGGTALRDAVATALTATPLRDTRVEVTAVPDDPVVRGGLDAAMAAVRARLGTRLGP